MPAPLTLGPPVVIRLPYACAIDWTVQYNSPPAVGHGFVINIT